MYSRLAHLHCTRCGTTYERDARVNVCAQCGGALFPRYHAVALDRDAAAGRARSIWRWHELMPVEEPENVVSLGEGGTPLLRADRLGPRFGFRDLRIKDESGNPTGSFKARGLSAAVTAARKAGRTALQIAIGRSDRQMAALLRKAGNGPARPG